MVHIGIDFDNTIVSYDCAFYKVALKNGLISKDVKKSKKMVRDAIRMLPEGNDKWTELQGLIYGLRMDDAVPMEGVERFLLACRKNSVKVSIISHKTVYPAMGPRIDLQAAARTWLMNRNFLADYGIAADEVVFEETLKGKLEQISRRGCTYFIDDLKEVLAHEDFPAGVKRIIYSREMDPGLPPDILIFKEWDEIKEHFFN